MHESYQLGDVGGGGSELSLRPSASDIGTCWNAVLDRTKASSSPTH